MMTSDPNAWLGNTARSEDTIAPLLVERMAATFGVPVPGPGEPLPHLWHWAFFQPSAATSSLGTDGHPARGDFLPPADNRNRMWAGSRLRFHRPLRVDSPADRESEITDIREKQGRSGSLLFVTVRHLHRQAGELAIEEEQDIVYRQPSPAKASLDKPLEESDWRETITPAPSLLFRYSAVTFNAHRIHYDWPYVTETEGYAGLVVHGPMIATLLIQAFTNANPTARVQTFSYRGLRPLLAPEPFNVCGRIKSPGQASLWAANEDGPAHEGELTFSEDSR